MSELVSPKQIVICEGKPINLGGKNKEFDAQCLRVIFNDEFEDTDFVSVGNEKEVRSEKLDLVTAIKSLTTGVEIIKLVDRDDKSQREIEDLENDGVKVLERRDIESYLFDDEIIGKLCKVNCKEILIDEVLEMKKDAIDNSISRGNPIDDVKSASGVIYNNLKRILGLTQGGNTVNTFLRDTMAPLVTPDTKIYLELKKEIFE